MFPNRDGSEVIPPDGRSINIFGFSQLIAGDPPDERITLKNISTNSHTDRTKMGQNTLCQIFPFILLVTSVFQTLADSSFHVNSAVGSGTGCPDGGVTISTKDDELTIAYGSFYPKTGPHVSDTQRVQRCDVSIELGDIPVGQRLELERIRYKGDADLEPNTDSQNMEATVEWKGDTWEEIVSNSNPVA